MTLCFVVNVQKLWELKWKIKFQEITIQQYVMSMHLQLLDCNKLKFNNKVKRVVLPTRTQTERHATQNDKQR